MAPFALIADGTSLAMLGWTDGPEEPAAELDALGPPELPQAARTSVAVSARPIVVRRRERKNVRPISRSPLLEVIPKVSHGRHRVAGSYGSWVPWRIVDWPWRAVHCGAGNRLSGLQQSVS